MAMKGHAVGRGGVSRIPRMALTQPDRVLRFRYRNSEMNIESSEKMPPGSFKEKVKERFMQAVERVKRPKKVHKGITACPEDRHIHVQVFVAFFIFDC